ncbi:2,4-dienoyl-CoA reductase-like NADH-dependent reductase (Old Yellow Enzyme family) [Mesorhizobium sp. J18]|uniref:NADH:flavin oxidoreductase/NADH oxidase n=1 Tax=Mesorhizobium sp. J18 TaxID=935263 RepID=UPI00119C8E29|nr:NADH:flavin oxidoreductase/NADH oxidase [Mesorhizobium sp. J18]TWG97304.1 2,4-dienoyl-CoA reductase-like NADH-dependent reductase (Old Yellow Enzyme family) [Mesorhizobium sp. J18]
MSPGLFSPFNLRGLRLDNRIVVSPMGQHSAVGGHVNDWHLAHLGQLAVSGAGLLITEAVAVEPRGRISPGCLGIWSDEHIAGYRRVIDFARTYGQTRMGIQLGHSGRKGSVSQSWFGQKTLSEAEGGWEIVNASPIAYPDRKTPTEIDLATIGQTTRQFADAARRADAAGFDVIEIHAAHGYLIHGFLTPLLNKRTDAYGGSLENRMRFGLEVFSAVRDAFPADKVVGVRVSATDWIDGGWTLEETIEFSSRLKALGCDYICASTGGVSPEQQIPVGPLYQVRFAESIRRETGAATMAVGLINEPEQAESVVAEGKADLVALGRAMLYNPRWPWQAAESLGAQVYYPVQYDRAHPSMRRNNAFIVQRERGS